MADYSTHIRRGHPITFAIFTVVALIVAITSSVLVANYNQNSNSPSSSITSSTRYLVFAGWWGFLVGVIYTALFLASVGGVLTSIAGHAIVIFVTWAFWLGGAGAITGDTGGSFSCSGQGHPFPYCNSTKALQAFSWIGWVILTFMLVMVMVIGAGAFRGGRSVKESLA